MCFLTKNNLKSLLIEKNTVRKIYNMSQLIPHNTPYRYEAAVQYRSLPEIQTCYNRMDIGEYCYSMLAEKLRCCAQSR